MTVGVASAPTVAFSRGEGPRPRGEGAASNLDNDEGATTIGSSMRSPATSVESSTRAVIFDLDGVLVWSAPMHWRAFEKTFASVGRSFPFEEYMSFAIGAPREQVILQVLGELPEPEMRRLMDAKETHVKEYLRDEGIEAIPGALDFVAAVRARSLKTAVASASRTPELMLEAVGAVPLFDVIVGRAKVARSKPHPDVYLLAAESLRVPPCDCIVIEDSSIGVEAARAAGMRVLALTTTEKASNLSKATAVFSSFSEVDLDHWFR
jgi:beta-phosphoglucomutase